MFCAEKCAAVLLALCALVATVEAEDFRIATKVFIGPEVEEGEEVEPVSETTTLFRGGTVYDFLGDSQQIAVFRKPLGSAPGRFILLDPQRKIRTELSTGQLQKFATGLKAWSAAQDDPLLKFNSNPNFQESWDASSAELTLASPVVQYRVVTEPMPSRQAALQYREFSDWYARLGALLYPGSTPPFARLAVNAALSEYQAMPTEVHLRIAEYKSLRKDDIVMRSEHTITWRLSKADQDRIDQAGAYLVQFPEVELGEFQR